MKIIFFVPHLSTGGMPQYVLWLTEELVKDNQEVYVVEFSDIAPIYVVQKNKIRALIKDKLITLHGTDDQKRLKLEAIISNFKPDIVHLQEFPETWLPELISKDLYASDRAYKIFETTHGSDFNPEDKVYLPDQFCFISNFYPPLYNHLKIPFVIKEYPVLNKDRQDRKEGLLKLGLDPEYKHVLNVGLFTPSKNQREVFNIAKMLENYKIQFHFVGNQADNFKNYWEPLMKEKPTKCIWWGEKSNVDDFYSCMDLFLFTSIKEANPLVVKEALGWNMPIFMYNLPVYCGAYDDLNNVHFLGNEMSANCKRILDFFNMETSLMKEVNDNKILSYIYSVENGCPKIEFSCLTTLKDGEKCTAIMREFETNLYLYGFDFEFSKGNSYYFSSGKNIKYLDGLIFEVFDSKNNKIFEEVVYINQTIDKDISEAFSIGMTQNRSEITSLYNFLKDKNINNILEIGTEKGGTFKLWCTLGGCQGKKISLDVKYLDGIVEKMQSWSDNVFIVEGDSHSQESLNKVKEILAGEKLDFLFIDGDHSYEGVKKDYTMYKDLVRENGYIAFHDINGINSNYESSGHVYIFWEELNGDKKEFNEHFIDLGIGLVKKNDKMNHLSALNDIDGESIFVIGAWVSSDIQKKMLKECIEKCRECSNAKILLATHCPIDADVLEMVDYFIYDKDNPILYSSEYPNYKLDYLFYWDNGKIRLETRSPYRHDYAVWTTMRNAFNYAAFLNKKYIYYLEYDCEPDPVDFKKEFIDKIREKDVCVLSNFGNDEGSFYFNIFSIKTDLALKFISRYESKEEFFTKNSGFNLVEKTFYNLLHENNANIYITNYNKKNVDKYCHIHSKKIIKDDFEGYIFPSFNGDDFYISVIVQKNKPVRNGEIILYRFKDNLEVYPVRYNNFEIFVFKVGNREELETLPMLHEEIEISNEKGVLKKIVVEDLLNNAKNNLLLLKQNIERKNMEEDVCTGFFNGMLQDSIEINDFYNFIKSKDIKNFLEIGTNSGGAFYLWCKASHKDGKKISLDLPSGSFDINTRNKKMQSWSDNVFIVEGDSHSQESLNKVKEILAGEKLDFLFIDGDHSYEGVKKDYTMYKDIVRENGYIAFHDIKNTSFHKTVGCDVSIFWEELNGDKKEFISDSEYGGIGLIRNKSYSKKTSFICFDSSSLGDTIAWIPYVEEFRKKNNCNVFISTFWNFLFQKEYPLLNFVSPGSVVHNIHEMFNIGWYTPWRPEMNPIDYRTIPLQQTASDILRLPFREIKPKITIPDSNRNIEGKYVCIGIHSTAQSKYWNYPHGWQIITDYLNERGFKVVLISKEKDSYMGNRIPINIINKTGNIAIEDRIVDLYYADAYIGIGSGLSWLAWAVGTPTILISGFSAPWCEPKEGIERVYNPKVCNSCFNDPSIEFDKGDWNWCPRKKDFECSRKITPEMVIKAIDKILGLKEK